MAGKVCLIAASGSGKHGLGPAGLVGCRRLFHGGLGGRPASAGSNGGDRVPLAIGIAQNFRAFMLKIYIVRTLCVTKARGWQREAIAVLHSGRAIVDSGHLGRGADVGSQRTPGD
ncbi:hypothetical protein AG1IA_04195 [Rhizoctonia solani AG-1 IA]|uniref:Uncharacterized protein n=1 Tax=Thanatephorus cucumeris (strain AG1-IA) TaxID=983506 RepID=L8WY89_THACA|nr:hypothetical protein AG1IA_04195 [Rhizoctonia solani AG-1 IA]